MVQISDKRTCCGCTACESICPKKCISMISDSEGFVYPIVESKDCIHCDLCESVCPVINSKKLKHSNNIKNTYVGYSKNENIRMESSSGGIFSLVAEYVLDQNGIVFGAAYDEQFIVKHIGIDNKNDLYKLRGSKYLQSNLSGIYNCIQKELKAERLVLFTGTACQISGLKSYLKKEYSNLITIDILCHGVPSPGVWRRYINEKEQENGKIVAINLRSKNNGWYNYATRFEFSSGKVLECSHFDDLYMRLFLADICLRPSCHDCHFKNMDRQSDITIGDSWGIDRLLPQFTDDKGTSVIVIHSLQGQKIFKEIISQIVCVSVDLDTVLPREENSRKSVEAHINRKKFFVDYMNGAPINQLQRHLNKSIFDRLRRKIRNTIKGL